MNKSPLVYLEDIISSITQIEEYVKNINWNQFVENAEKQDAVIRRFEIIGEASRKLEDNFRETYSQIPWEEMVRFRNILIHNYSEVDLEIIWQVIQDGDLSKAKYQIQDLFNSLESK